MIQNITGPNGAWTEGFDEHTADLLERMGFIEKDGQPRQVLSQWVDGEWQGCGPFIQFWKPVDNRPTAG